MYTYEDSGRRRLHVGLVIKHHTMPIPVLPPELIAIIILCLQGDRQSLIACSRVARCWLDPSRTHLFRTLTIFVLEPDWLSHILDFLDDSRYVSPYVRVLNMWTVNNGYSAYEPICHHTITSFLTRLHDLQAIHMSNLHLFCNHDEPHGDTADFKLDSLIMHHCYTEQEPVLPLILQCFSAVRQLRVEQYTGSDFVSSLSSASQLHIQDLRISCLGTDDLIPALGRCPQEMSVSLGSNQHVTALGNFIDSVGSSLRQLAIVLEENPFVNGTSFVTSKAPSTVMKSCRQDYK